MLSSKQNICEYVGTLSESVIAIFSYTFDGHNVRQRHISCVVEPGHTITTHVER